MIYNRLQFFLLTFVAVSFLLVTGCSDSDKPENFEPIIEVLPATDITRTEARVSGIVHKRGTTELTSLAFYYAIEGATETFEPINVDNPGAEKVEALMTDLKPGTTYTYYLEGNTATASLRSETLTFTTEPNVLPTVTQPVLLSTGPTGVIIEFEITSDGGEELFEAGCEVTSVTDGSSWKVNVEYKPIVGNYRLIIGKLKPSCQYTVTPFATNSIGEFKGQSIDFTTPNSVILKEAGSLQSVFDGAIPLPHDRLVISGEMNGDDFRFLRRLLGASPIYDEEPIESTISEIDLTDVRIVEGGWTYDGQRYTENDILTTGILGSCPRLRVAILPSTVKVIERNAVARCTSLKEFAIPAAVETLLPSEGCTALSTIDVSAANTNFAAVDGVVFNHDITDIVWFPAGKTGDYTVPSSVTKISENAFLGTNITSLVIPPSVTTISRGAFVGSALKEITLPDNLTNISEGMFQNCFFLTTLHLGTGTYYIGGYAFDGTMITNLYVSATRPPWVADYAFYNSFFSMTQRCVLHVPAASVKSYRNHSKWGKFEQIVAIEP